MVRWLRHLLKLIHKWFTFKILSQTKQNHQLKGTHRNTMTYYLSITGFTWLQTIAHSNRLLWCSLKPLGVGLDSLWYSGDNHTFLVKVPVPAWLSDIHCWYFLTRMEQWFSPFIFLHPSSMKRQCTSISWSESRPTGDSQVRKSTSRCVV